MSTLQDTAYQLFKMVISRDQEIKRLKQRLADQEHHWATQNTLLRSEMLNILRECERKQEEAKQRERELKNKITKLIMCAPCPHD